MKPEDYPRATSQLKLNTRVFALYKEKYPNLVELAQTMGISTGQIYRVKQGKRGINQKFIIGAAKAFPGYNLDDLFYIEGQPVKILRSGPSSVNMLSKNILTNSMKTLSL